MNQGETRSVTGRREPPAFLRVEVTQSERLGERMIRVTFAGPELAGFTLPEPAASVRLLLPTPPSPDLVIPAWNGNEFLLADGTRPIIRTFTPRYFDAESLELDLDMVIHPGGVASSWALSALPGYPAAVSGPGRGYTIDVDASDFLLVGDETAIPAISQLLECLPDELPVHVHVEIATESGVVSLPDHPATRVDWHRRETGRRQGDALLAAIQAAQIGPDTRIWSAGEAAAMHRIRTHLFKELGVPRPQATVRGYWKVDRATP